MNRLSAEITKIGLNCFLASKITYANMIGDMAVKNGLDPVPILSAIGCDSRIGNKYFKYGFGYGGPCFPRDIRALNKYIKDIGIHSNMIESIRQYNRNHLDFQVDEFVKSINGDDPIVIEGVGYKKGIPIIEESQQLLFALSLSNMGYKVIIQDDPIIIQLVKEIYGDKFIYQDIKEI